jgi:formylglycine-generating enzyme required for sulfatase activity
MSARISFAAFAVWVVLMADALAAEPVAGPLLSWTGVNGTVVRAAFVRLEGSEVVLVLENGSERSVPFSWFDPRSLDQARKAGEAKPRSQGPGVTQFIRIPKGRFKMGSPLDEPGRIANPDRPAPPPRGSTDANNSPTVREYEPEHQVVITRDFWMKTTEVTWQEWNQVRSESLENGYTDIAPGSCGYGVGPDANLHPVTDISWLDAVKWCNAKSQIEGRTPVYHTLPGYETADHYLITGESLVYADWDASGYRLPTEAEWEYACREGRSSGSLAFHSGPISSIGVVPLDRNLDLVGWYGGNSGGTTRPVGTREPNRHGLYDMHGNASEWCWDFADFLDDKEARDPSGTAKGDRHIYRGGSWADPARCCRSAYRSIYSPAAPKSPTIGFRPVCGSDPSQPPPAKGSGPRRKPADN